MESGKVLFSYLCWFWRCERSALGAAAVGFWEGMSCCAGTMLQDAAVGECSGAEP